LGLKKLA